MSSKIVGVDYKILHRILQCQILNEARKLKNYKSIGIIAVIFILMYVFNYLMPMSYGDDYLYSFVWKGDHGFFEPLPPDSRLISSWSDVFDSLYNHYLTHAGRTMIFLPNFFFLWQGKDLFNFFNAFLAVLLVLEIYWISNRGIVTLDLKPSRICFIFFILWTFTIGFPVVFLWLTGACNYLWASVLTLGFLLPYVRRYYDSTSRFPAIPMFFFGLIAGWTNENTICWFIVLLALQIYDQKRRGESIDRWQISGLLGLSIGYALLILAPGNFVRLAEDSTMIPDDWWIRFLGKATTFFMAMLSQLLMWFFFRDTMRHAEDFGDDETVKRSLTIVKSFAIMSLASNLIMFLAPEFPMRSVFPSLLYLLISVTTLIRLQHETGRNPMKTGARYFLHAVGSIYFAVTLIFSIYGSYLIFEHHRNINSLAESASEDQVLEVENFESTDRLYFATGMHLVNVPLSSDENSWENVAYSKYYKIKGIKAK